MEKNNSLPYRGYTLLVILVLLLSACTVSRLQILSDIKTFPTYPIQHPPELILLLSTYDIKEENLRDNKEELFIELVDSTLQELSRNIGYRTTAPMNVIYGLSKPGPAGDMQPLLKEHNASHAIAVTCFDVYFIQTDVVVTEDEYSKSKEAFYDIVSEINYTLYDTTGPVRDMQVSASQYHSSRSVISGLLAAGPNIVNNKESALAVMKDNVEKYLNYFLPGQAQRYRTVFVGKELSKVNEGMEKGDYEAALKESLLLINHPDREVAAKANYNCAVLLENQHKQSVAKSYLEKSLQLYILKEAWEMKGDYGL